jgi:hypothetical protein
MDSLDSTITPTMDRSAESDGIEKAWQSYSRNDAGRFGNWASEVEKR